MKYLSGIIITSVILISACGGGGSGGSNSTSGDAVEDTLTSLGVDISPSQREGDNNEPLPEDYSPFGSARSFESFDELVMLGFPLSASSGFSSELTLLELDRNPTSVTYATDVLFAPNPALTPWAQSKGDNPASLRVAVRGDIDMDGLEELVVVSRSPGQNAIELKVYEDQVQSFVENQSFVLSSNPTENLALASGDFNGDGFTDLVVGMVQNNFASLMFIENDNGQLNIASTTRSLPQAFINSEIELILETGNLDYDPSSELVVLVNELFQQPGPGNPESGTTRYFVFDDRESDYIELGNALVQADLSAVNRTAVVSDVSLGDIDGDNLDEIVFAGLTSFDPNGQCAYSYLIVVLDDQIRNRDPVDAIEQQPAIHGGCATAGGELRFVHVNTPDLDGDGFAEIQVNELVYEDFAGNLPWSIMLDGTGTPVELPDDSLFADNSGFTGRFSQLNSAMVVADLTADKRDDIVLYSQSTNRLEIWGLSDPGPDGSGGVIQSNEWRMLKSIATKPPVDTDDLRPLLIPVNVNHDSLAIAFDEGEYQLVFTEPVLIAALAAAPCYADLGQNTDACRTSYGTADSTTVALENTLTISAGVTVGFEAEFDVLGTKVAGVEALATVKAKASLITSAAYTYTERVEYTTGPIEDTVIFTSIPYDRYTYTILSNPDPDLIGSKIVVSMPRSPVTLQVERSFYNANVVHGGPKIDSTVFTHSAGFPPTYPSASQKDRLIAQYSSLLPSGWAYDFGPTSVGQGGGDTTLEINVATESGIGVGVGIEAEFAAQVTAGTFVSGFSVGVSAESSLQVVHGDEATYTGGVANLPSTNFASNSYNWGLFTYAMDDHPSGQKFEVINYWVE